MQKPKPFKPLSTGLPSLFILTALGCTACSSVYVGDVSFSATEICSKEFASGLHLNSGCLPPARAANAQRYFFERFRLPLSGDEKTWLEMATTSSVPSTTCPASCVVSATSTVPPTNLLPSLIGRLVVAQSENGKIIMPDTGGNIEFLPLNDKTKDIPTEVFVNTDLAGVIQSKLQINAQFDAAEIVNVALRDTGLIITDGLRDKLVMHLAATREKTAASEGRYYYVGMTHKEVDQLVADIKGKGWHIQQAPANGETRRDWLLSPYTALSDSSSLVSAVCATPGTCTNPNISLSKTMEGLSDYPCAKAGNGEKKMNFALVIGAAILQTHAGKTKLCSQYALANYDNRPEASDCNSLKALLDDAFSQSAAASASAVSAIPTITSAISSIPTTPPAIAAQTSKLLIALSAGYTRATYKTMQIGNHASVLAIHWLPIAIPTQGENKCPN